MKTLLVINEQLKEHGCTLNLYREEDLEGLYEIYQEVIEAGTNFPHEFGTKDEFENCFFAPHSSVYVLRSKEKVLGGFYLKPNFPGRARHIANAAYMLHKSARGKGLGRLLTEASLPLAKELGYLAIQFNMVFSQNLPAVHLYKKIGFEIIGTIPKACRTPDGSYQAGYIMYQSLE